ncbi:MAG: hypothetical protein FJX76_23185 [Armatimonadetes bacterium]|nr:hypothetical protein [Armatimonadota bacterium]
MTTRISDISPTPTQPESPLPPSGGSAALQPSISDVLMDPVDRVDLSCKYVDADNMGKFGKTVGGWTGAAVGTAGGAAAGSAVPALGTWFGGIAGGMLGAGMGMSIGETLGRGGADVWNGMEHWWKGE